MNWAAPAYAWLLLLGIPAAILIRRAIVRQRQDLSRLTGVGRRLPASLRIRPLLSILISTVAFLLAIAALCRPQWGQVTVQQQSKGFDILIALDVSRSMLADDLPPTRLAAAKDAVARLLPHLQGDRIGLIAFAGSAFLVCPLTSDYSTFGGVLAETGTDTIPLGGSSLASALVEAKRAFGQTQGQGRFLIVMSDGEDHGSDVAAAAQALRDAGITIHSVAAGTLPGGLIPLPQGGVLRNREGAIVKSRLQKEPLLMLAATTGGSQHKLANDPETLVKLHAVLPAADQHDIRRTRKQLAERFQLPLALAIFLMLIEPFVIRCGKP